MKKIKLLTSLAGLSALSMGLVPAIASCSCSSTRLDVELLSKKKEREFNQKTNGAIYTFKVSDVSTSTKLKIKLVNLLVDDAETQSVAGLLKTTYDSAGNVRVFIDTNVLASQWPNAKHFTFDLEFTDKETGKTTTLTGFSLDYNALLTAPSFETVDWSVIFEKAQLYYEGALTADDFAKSFGDEDGFAFSSIDQYVGLERTVTINTLTHKIRIIGVNHDKLTTATTGSTTALFTFELVTILSKSDGSWMQSYLNTTTSNADYYQSTLRNNLTGTATWTGGKNAYTLLIEGTPSLSGNIQTVTKHYQKNSGTSSAPSWADATYNDTLFSLTRNEINRDIGELEPAIPEGTTYKYWKNIDATKSVEPWVKATYGGDARPYWLASPFRNNEMGGTAVSNSGGLVPFQTGTSFNIGVSFAFCI